MLAMGIVGGVFGILASILAMIVGGVSSSFGEDNYLVISGFVAMLLSIMGIIGGAISKSKPKLAGTLLLISGVLGFLCISLFYIITGILFIVAGFMGIMQKTEKTTVVS